ncbi:hypothetical protein NDU88_001943 [Pleurodeles waltl]|uniref:Uncharacterized protein n=1 Tax=Pleurodeles waltl TaxID=8319 RepID=A0AAV7UU65_PLEWA|nr:hypothetical protein NDU88_001943 [Pleurodeles waltl]
MHAALPDSCQRGGQPGHGHQRQRLSTEATDGRSTHQRESAGRGAALRQAQPRSGVAAPGGSEVLSTCLRRYPRAGASPVLPAVRARLRHSTPSPRRQPAAPGGIRTGRGRGHGSTAVRSQHTERLRRLICSCGYKCRSRAAE